MDISNIIHTIQRINSEYGLYMVIKRGVIRVVDKCLYSFLSKSNIQDKTIVFYSTPDFSDNSRILFEYMVRERYTDKYQLIWIVNSPVNYLKYHGNNIHFIKRYSLFAGHNRCVYYHQKAHWIFHTHGTPFPKRTDNSQIMVRLGHGGMGFKSSKGGMDTRQDNHILISGYGDVCYNSTGLSYGCNKSQLLPLGTPRNDLLFKYKEIDWIDSYTSTKILWMPTFRQSKDKTIEDDTLNSETGFPILNTFERLHEFNRYLESIGVVLFIKIHPLQDMNKITTSELNNIKILTNTILDSRDIQLYETLNHFSALITDYSSVSFDYLCLDRPIGYTLDDYEEYKNSRGFSMDNPLDYMPGKHIYTYDDLVDFVRDVSCGIDQYHEERKAVQSKVGLVDDGKCCKRLLNYLGIEK